MFRFLSVQPVKSPEVHSTANINSTPAITQQFNLEMIVLYYENPDMLRRQLICWSDYGTVLETPPIITVIDDGSPRNPAIDVIRRVMCGDLCMRVFRIKENIPWNCAGARNLGCFHAEGWIYVSDIDLLLPAREAKKLFEGMSLSKNDFYTTRRLDFRTGEERKPSLSNLLFHKELFLRIGGYDENYAGFYGHEDRDFLARLRRVARGVYRKDVTVQVVKPGVVIDARTRGYTRARKRNRALFEGRKRAGFPRPVNPLRFAWERVL